MGKRYIQDPQTLRLVPADEYIAPRERTHMIMPDIQDYTSMIDGSRITSRSHHRRHLREHGCIEVGNEKLQPKRREIPDFKQDIVRAMYERGMKKA